VIPLLDVAAVIAVIVLGCLSFLVLFERGAFYRLTDPVHLLEDGDRLRLLTAILTTPAQSVQSVAVITEGAAFYDSQLSAIRAARSAVHLEAYIFLPGRAATAVLEALCERARDGVRVRVIVDAIGSWRTRRSYFAPLVAAGGSVQWYHPLRWQTFRRWNNRTHRNLLTIDAEVAFVGGAGIADHWSRTEPAPWRDNILRVTGPIVAGLQAVFAENWLECSGELLVGGESFPAVDPPLTQLAEETLIGIAVGSTPTAGRSTRARVIVQILLAMARESIDLCSPYFIPDVGIRRELRAACERGVRVRTLTGGVYSDQGLVRRAGRRRFGPLLEAGVEIWEFAPRMMHAKLLVVDGRWVLVGSTNIDHRSFGLNDEVNLLVLSPTLGATMTRSFEQDLAKSERLDLAGWRRRPLLERILATLGRIIERHQ
jgi:cardiolipin synthase